MPEIMPKSEELLQAQVATFAAETIDDGQNRKAVFNTIGSTALAHVNEPITRVLKNTDYVPNPDGGVTFIPAGTEVVAAHPEQYKAFMREKGGSNYEPIRAREKLLVDYKKYAPNTADQQTHLGKGSNAHAATYEKDGQNFVIRYHPEHQINPWVVDSYAEALIRGKDAPHFEQIKAISYTEGSTISELMPGKPLSEVSKQEILDAPEDQFDAAITLSKDAVVRGIRFDPRPDNFLFDAKEGIGVIDYEASDLGESELLQSNTLWLADALVQAGENIGNPTSAAEFAQSAQIKDTVNGILKRYYVACERQLSTEQFDLIASGLSSRIQKNEQIRDNYRNPQWVSDQLAYIARQEASKAARHTEGSTIYSDEI